MWWQQVSSLYEWSFTICPMPYNSGLSVSLNKTFLIKKYNKLLYEIFHTIIIIIIIIIIITITIITIIIALITIKTIITII